MEITFLDDTKRVSSYNRKKDYYWEYVELVDKVILDFIQKIESCNISAFSFGSAVLTKSIRDNLSIKLLLSGSYRKDYNNQRKRGEKKSVLYNKILALLMEEYSDFSTNDKVPVGNLCVINSNLTNFIEYNNRILFYCINQRQLSYLLPILNNLKRKVILLATFEIDNDVILNDNIVVLEWIYYLEHSCVKNDYLINNFPTIYHDANTILTLLNIFLPKAIFVLEGCHEDMEAIASLAKVLSIPTICIQQGWPSYIYTRFKDMNYDYFLTWGEKFNNLWSKYNRKTKFIDIGYLYSVSLKSDLNSITFFFQSPVIILDEEYFEIFVEFCIFCAKSFPNRRIYIREHPEYSILKKHRILLSNNPNVEFHNDTPLETLFAMTQISVAIFSSTIIESIVHDCIPFVFNPTASPRYTPNLPNEKIGIFANSLNSAKRKIERLDKNPNICKKIIENIKKQKSSYFTSTDLSSLKNINLFLKENQI